MVMERGRPFVISNDIFSICAFFLEIMPNIAIPKLYANNKFCWSSCSTTFISKILKVEDLLSFAKTLVFVLVFAFVICLCLIVCRSLSAGWFHGCGPSAWNCHSFPMGSFASFRALFSLSLIFFFFYALKLFDYLDAFLWSFPGLKRTHGIWNMITRKCAS